jgi:DNA polymerase IV
MSLDLPPIYILPTNLQPEELQSLEDQIPSLTWDIHEAELILGRISRRERALFELRRLKVATEELLPPHTTHAHDAGEPSPKRRRIASDDQSASLAGRDAAAAAAMSPTDGHELERSGDTIKVLKLSWLTESLEKGIALPFGNHLLYEGRRLRSTEQPETHGSHGATAPGEALARVVVKSMPPPANEPGVSRAGRRGDHSRGRGVTYPPAALIHQTTSDHDVQLPPIPAFLQTTYSCQRPTPVNPPNAGFVEALKEVRTLRQLEGDEVGVRAYASSIASVAAYPFTLRTPRGKLYLSVAAKERDRETERKTTRGEPS